MEASRSKTVTERDAKRFADERDRALEDLATARREVAQLRADLAGVTDARDAVPPRKRLPDERGGRTRKFCILRPDEEPLKIYVNAAAYPDTGKLGEIFLKVDRQGSLASGALDAVAICVSVGLQHGVPLEAYATKLVGARFEPNGYTGDPTYPKASSVLDLVFRWLLASYGEQKRAAVVIDSRADATASDPR